MVTLSIVPRALDFDELWVEEESLFIDRVEEAGLATFVLSHGAGGTWYWHLLEPELHDRGHVVVAMDLRMTEPSPLSARPDVPTRAPMCRDDRLFPTGWLRAVVIERLGITCGEIDGGCVALSRPKQVADRLHGFHS